MLKNNLENPGSIILTCKNYVFVRVWGGIDAYSLSTIIVQYQDLFTTAGRPLDDMLLHLLQLTYVSTKNLLLHVSVGDAFAFVLNADSKLLLNAQI